PDLARIEFGRGPHAGNDRDLAFPAAPYQVQFAGEVVDSVNHVIVAGRKENIAVLRTVELLEGYDVGLRVDEAEPLRHDVRLGFADRTVHGMQLAVDVRQA